MAIDHSPSRVGRYPSRSQIARAVQAARANGIAVNALSVRPDGSIRVSAMGTNQADDRNLFDQLDSEGRL